MHLLILQQMQNKNNFLKTAYSTPGSRYYRSTKYKINRSTAIDPSSTTFIDLNSSKMGYQTQTTWRKPASYSLKKTTRQRPSVENVEQFDVEMKGTYLQTWRKLMAPVEVAKNQEQRGNTGRVCLPSIIQYQPSNFTSLDPLFLPFQHIQRGISELKRELPGPKIDMAQIHHDMINFKAKIMNELELTQQYGIKEFQKLRKMLRTDKVLLQQTALRFKRQCQELYEEDQKYRVDFQSTKPRLDILQDDLFSCRPFDLDRNPGLNEQFPQAYF